VATAAPGPADYGPVAAPGEGVQRGVVGVRECNGEMADGRVPFGVPAANTAAMTADNACH